MTSPLQQKLRVKGPVVVTANSLADGGVLWWVGDGWSRSLDGASVVTNADDARALLSAAEAHPASVGAYVAPVEIDAGGVPRPANMRETIRVSGPTTPMPDHIGERSATAAIALETPGAAPMRPGGR